MPNEVILIKNLNSNKELLINAIQDKPELQDLLLKNMWAIVSNPTLANTSIEKQSISNALIQATLQGISFSNKEAYIIPYNNKAQVQVGIEYYVKALGIPIELQMVLDCDKICRSALTGELYIEYNTDYTKVKNAKIIGYYARVSEANKFISVYMSKDEVNEHAKKYSKSYNAKSGIWEKEYDKMAKNVVLKAICRRALRENFIKLEQENITKIKDAISLDQAVIEGEGTNLTLAYPDNPQQTLYNSNAKTFSTEPIPNPYLDKVKELQTKITEKTK